MYKYQIYGLRIDSDIEIPEALERTDCLADCDVTVHIAGMPKDVEAKKQADGEAGARMFYKEDALYFRIPEVAEYFVQAAVIIVNPASDASGQSVRTFLLGSAMGFCMVLRNMVVLHGGAIESEGRGIIITGESGAGKSTVVNALRMRGAGFIADDVCAIESNSGKTHINLAYPQQKICRDAAVNMGYDLSQLIYINEERDKFAVRLDKGYLKDGYDFHYLFELKITDNDKLTFTRIEGHEKLFTIIRNIYRGDSAFDMWSMPPQYMKQCLDIASGIQVYRIERPRNVDTLEEIVSDIQTQIRSTKQGTQ